MWCEADLLRSAANDPTAWRRALGTTATRKPIRLQGHDSPTAGGRTLSESATSNDTHLLHDDKYIVCCNLIQWLLNHGIAVNGAESRIPACSPMVTAV